MPDQVRVVRLMRRIVQEIGLDLRDRVVLTEAATRAYACTATIAALAGARVHALGRASRHGAREEAAAATRELARAAGVGDRVVVIESVSDEIAAAADIVTNSGALRPIDARFVSRLARWAVVPLMYESWELREEDLDVRACRARGIAFGGTNERHPQLDVFSYLGPMAVHLLHRAGIPVFRCRILLLCDNSFGDPLETGLDAAGAQVFRSSDPDGGTGEMDLDAIVVALTPAPRFRLDAGHLARLSPRAPGAVVAQFWGDIDREAAARHGFDCWPRVEPARGHMGILPSEIGPDPIVRLQAGGLKVGEVLLRRSCRGEDPGWAYVDEAWCPDSGLSDRMVRDPAPG